MRRCSKCKQFKEDECFSKNSTKTEWIISNKANRMKNNATPEEILLLAKNIKKFISQF